MPKVEIISQGDELINGQIVDSNAAWLAEQLVLMGFKVQRHSAVGDDVRDIKQAFAEACQRAELVICTGGLGPTQDDLTTEAVAQLSGQALVLDAEALRNMQKLFSRWGRPMPAVNEKQAWLPADAQRIDNHWGTAPGFSLRVNNAWVVCLPGVPSEMKAMFEHTVKQLLRAQFMLQPSYLVTFRTVGAGESSLQQRIGPFFHERVALSYRAMGREVQIKLRFEANCPVELREQLCANIRAVLGDDVFAIEGWGEYGAGDLGEQVAQALSQHQKTLVLAESSSAGRLTQLLKTADLKKPPLLAAYYFETSEQLTRQLMQPAASLGGYEQWAEQLRRLWTADFVLLTSPLQTLDLQESTAPFHDSALQSGTCYLLGEGESVSQTLRLSGAPAQKQQALAYAGLDLLRRRLLKSYCANQPA